MKKKIWKSLLLLLAVTAVSAVSAQSKSSQKENERIAKARIVAQALNERSYTINAERAFPTGARSFALPGGYTLSVWKDKVRSHLPYVGRLYRAPLGRDEGLNFFDTPVENYEMKDGKKDSKIITFNTHTLEEKYKIRLEVFPNGSTMINIMPENRQAISFNGELITD